MNVHTKKPLKSTTTHTREIIAAPPSNPRKCNLGFPTPSIGEFFAIQFPYHIVMISVYFIPYQMPWKYPRKWNVGAGLGWGIIGCWRLFGRSAHPLQLYRITGMRVPDSLAYVNNVDAAQFGCVCFLIRRLWNDRQEDLRRELLSSLRLDP
jgi:hypothetical protein